ncbi:MATE family efflux transporter [Defluviimonas sp. WL0075]|uniref:Multidrug-efflux transporter n=1 Tax=Albidovulum sediminicola TaxID=2984331 RepID=A0ABT2Z1E7_9RHOB|nr:MATE family efflux transporter [Defluviimonas sp. WL0075]MCV2864968.1 MATE family efflux transporter [Defluviimonas sp. WL0075]
MVKSISYPAQARALLALGLPLIGSNIAQMALHVADTVMVGRYGTVELAAVVIGSSTFFVVFILGSGFAQAVMPMVASSLARGDEVQVRRDTRMGLWLSIGFALLTVPFFWWSGRLLHAVGQEPRVAELGQDYLRIAGLGMLPALVVVALRSLLSALERAGVVLWATLAGVLLNIFLNWLLIFGNWGAPELGVKGAAIASVATQFLMMGLLALYASFHHELRRFHLFVRFWRPDGTVLRQVFRLGWPIGLTGLFESGLFEAAAIMMGWIGAVELASHGIALQLAAITFMVHLGLSNAATVRAGRAFGMGDVEGLRDGARVAIVMSTGFAMATVIVFLAFPGLLIGLFLDPANPQGGEIIAYATGLLAVAALFQMADSAQVMALGLLRGIHDTRVPMIIASVSYWLIGIPVSYILAFRLGMGGIGLWLGLVVGLVVAAVLLMLRFWRWRGSEVQPA